MAYALAPKRIKAFLQKNPVSRVVLAGEEGSAGHLVPYPGRRRRRTLHRWRPLAHKEDSELQACMLREVRSKVQRAYQKLSSSGRLCAHPDKLKNDPPVKNGGDRKENKLKRTPQ